jgi:hypothetical protein
MKITGPFLNKRLKKIGQPKCWYLSVVSPRTTPEGAPLLDDNGKRLQRRERPYYTTKEAAEADIPRLRAQHAVGGIGAAGMLTRAQLEDFDAALVIVPESEASHVDLARFWRLHHPRHAAAKLRELAPGFLEWVKARNGETRHYQDLRSRIGPVQNRSTGAVRDTPFLSRFGDRLPATVSREEFLAWLLTIGKAGRTVLNQKRAVVNFFNYLVDVAKIIPTNQLAGIKKRALPKAVPKEIAFLPLAEAVRYLRTLERYDPELVAHEIIQLFAGVRADDEMADFDGKWVMSATREIVIPAEIAKTERREVMDNLEANFWEWWQSYGREGILRPKNYEQRWERARILANAADQSQADELARLPIKTLRGRPESKAALQAWPWNARRRTFCTYHVAKHQSASRTALILRHRGDAETLHNSYRGLGVTQEQGSAYFDLRPQPASGAIRPERPARGIIVLQEERRKLEAGDKRAAAIASA